MSKAYILLMWVITLVIAGLFVLLYVSLLPHFKEIGDGMLWVIRLFMLCGCALMVVGTYCLINILLSKQRRARNHERLVTNGETAFYILSGGEDIYHASMLHEQGKVAQIAAPRDVTTDETTILELYDKGLSLRAIEKQLKDTGVTYYQIQKVTSAHRK